MSDPFTDRRVAARRIAAKFLAARHAGSPAGDAAAYAAWRAVDPEHERAAVEMEATDERLRRLPLSAAAADLVAEADALVASAGKDSHVRRWLQVLVPFAVAACVILAFSLHRTHHVTPTSVTATEARMLDLSDGSTLRLEAGAEVAVQYQPALRRIELRSGAAHFAVAKDAARPFVVAAGEVEVRAVGTAFDVRYGPAAVDIAVTEGKVAVTRARGVDAHAPLYLVAGERTAIARLAAGGTAAAPTPMAKSVTRSGAPRLEFADTPLADVVVQFNRYSRVQLEVGDVDLATRPVGGTFDADRADVFVNLLASSGDIRIDRISETHVVLRKAR